MEKYRDQADRIVSAACEYYSIPVEEVFTKTRKSEVVRARHAAMLLISRLTPISLTEQGRYFGREASTIFRSIATTQVKASRLDLSSIVEIIRRDGDPVRTLEDKGEESGRSLGPSERREFGYWVESHLGKRKAKGLAKYGNRFQGDPIDHLIEELVDALLYAWILEKRYRGGA